MNRAFIEPSPRPAVQDGMEDEFVFSCCGDENSSSLSSRPGNEPIGCSDRSVHKRESASPVLPGMERVHEDHDPTAPSKVSCRSNEALATAWDRLDSEFAAQGLDGGLGPREPWPGGSDHQWTHPATSELCGSGLPGA